MFNAENGSEIYSLLEFQLVTGKKHQIRLACAGPLAASIIGDRQYGFKGAPDLFRRSFKFTALQERELL
jgi:23S rRNA-/tRNA-specific pseudouridylate synthase